MAKRITSLLLAGVFLHAGLGLWPCLVRAQSAQDVTLQFEVASVRQNLSQTDASHISSTVPDRFVATNVPAYFLILYAYGLKDNQLVGAPEWTRDKAFDVVGKYPEERRPTDLQIRAMLQTLLVDRFGLKLHREQREVPAYDLVLARKDGRPGPQLHRSNVDCAVWQAAKRPQTDAGGPSPVSPSGKRPECKLITTRRYLTAGATTISELAASLQALVSRPVVDRTSLAGAYDIDLEWDPAGMYSDRPSNAAVTDASSGPSIFTAVEEQLGLKLVSQKEKFDVFVVDQIRPPTPN